MKFLLALFSLSLSLAAFSAPTKKIHCEIDLDTKLDLFFVLEGKTTTNVSFIAKDEEGEENGMELHSETLIQDGQRIVMVGFFMAGLEFKFSPEILDNSSVGKQIQTTVVTHAEEGRSESKISCKALN